MRVRKKLGEKSGIFVTFLTNRLCRQQWMVSPFHEMGYPSTGECPKGTWSATYDNLTSWGRQANTCDVVQVCLLPQRICPFPCSSSNETPRSLPLPILHRETKCGGDGEMEESAWHMAVSWGGGLRQNKCHWSGLMFFFFQLRYWENILIRSHKRMFNPVVK